MSGVACCAYTAVLGTSYTTTHLKFVSTLVINVARVESLCYSWYTIFADRRRIAAIFYTTRTNNARTSICVQCSHDTVRMHLPQDCRALIYQQPIRHSSQTSQSEPLKSALSLSLSAPYLFVERRTGRANRRRSELRFQQSFLKRLAAEPLRLLVGAERRLCGAGYGSVGTVEAERVRRRQESRRGENRQGCDGHRWPHHGSPSCSSSRRPPLLASSPLL